MLEDSCGIKFAYLHAKMQTPGDVAGVFFFLGGGKGVVLGGEEGGFHGGQGDLMRLISFTKKMQHTSDYLS